MNELTRPAADGSPEPTPLIQCVSLVVRIQARVQSLSGFRKSFSVPDEVNTRTQSFVEKLGAPDIKSDLDDVFTSLRTGFRFKRSEIITNEFSAGGGSLECPYFTYTSFVEQHPTEAGDAVWHRLISEIREPEQLLTDNFASVFANVFDTVELIPQEPIDLEQLIDRIEEVDRPNVTLDYDRNITHCGIAILGNKVTVDVTPGALRIVHAEPTTPRALVASLFEIQKELVDFSTLGKSS